MSLKGCVLIWLSAPLMAVMLVGGEKWRNGRHCKYSFQPCFVYRNSGLKLLIGQPWLVCFFSVKIMVLRIMVPLNHVASCPRISRDHLRGFLMLIPRICHAMNHREHFRYSVCVWFSEDRASWCIRLMKANEVHYFSNLLDKVLNKYFIK